MPSTTLKTLLEDFVEEYLGNLGAQLGVTTAAGTTTSLVDLARFGGPKSAAEWARGSPVRITGPLARAGQNTFLTTYTPATGTLALDPAITQPVVGDTFIIVQKSIADHIDRLIEALNRGLRRWARRRMKVPLTFVPNGDYLAVSAQSVFLDADGFQEVATYLDLAHPDGWYQRVIKLTGNDPDAYARSQRMKATPGDVWDIATAMYVTTAGMTTTLTVWDESNNALIPLVFSSGSASTSSLAPVDTRASFTIPAGCTSISVRPKAGFSGVAQQGLYGPIIAAPQLATHYTGQTWFEHIQRLGNFYTYEVGERSGSPVSRDLVRSKAALVSNDSFGWGEGLQFDRPEFPLYADALLSYPALSADADTTTCAEDLALAAMAYEFFSWAANTNRQTSIVRGRAYNTSPFDGQRDDAYRLLKSRQRSHGPVKGLTIHSEYSGKVRA